MKETIKISDDRMIETVEMRLLDVLEERVVDHCKASIQGALRIPTYVVLILIMDYSHSIWSSFKTGLI